MECLVPRVQTKGTGAIGAGSKARHILTWMLSTCKEGRLSTKTNPFASKTAWLPPGLLVLFKMFSIEAGDNGCMMRRFPCRDFSKNGLQISIQQVKITGKAGKTYNAHCWSFNPSKIHPLCMSVSPELF